ncbi:MAG: hypothetical protein ACYDAG_11465, partial [Chloroflexota bacterium]
DDSRELGRRLADGRAGCQSPGPVGYAIDGSYRQPGVLNLEPVADLPAGKDMPPAPAKSS